jgi:hypothetical protein
LPFNTATDALESLLTQPRNGTQALVVIDERIAEAPKFARSIKTHLSLGDTKIIMLGAKTADWNSNDVVYAVDAWVASPLRPSHLFKEMFELFSKAAPYRTATQRMRSF